MKIEDNKEELKRYFLLAVIFLLLFLSFKIIQPYLIVLISAFILSYLILPLYLALNKKLNKKFSAVLCILIILIAVLLPLGGIVGGIINQTHGLTNDKKVISFINDIELLPILNKLNVDLDSLFEKGTSLAVSLLSSALSYIPSLIISLIVLIFGIYYILINYENLSMELKSYLPFQDKNQIAEEIDKSTKGIIYGSFLIAVIEFVIAVIGFFLSGVDSYLLLPLIIFFFAFIPGLGPTLVWVPLAIYFAYTGNWFAFTGVIITGIILSVGVDTILKTKILGEKSKINPFIMLLGILGGISFFGIFGFIIGPLILIYSLKILSEYLKK